MLMIIFCLFVLVGGSIVHEIEQKKLEAKLRRARRMNIRSNKRRNNLSYVIQTNNNVSEKRKGPGRPEKIIPIQFQLSRSSQLIGSASKHDDLVEMILILVLYCFINFC